MSGVAMCTAQIQMELISAVENGGELTGDQISALAEVRKGAFRDIEFIQMGLGCLADLICSVEPEEFPATNAFQLSGLLQFLSDKLDEAKVITSNSTHLIESQGSRGAQP